MQSKSQTPYSIPASSASLVTLAISFEAHQPPNSADDSMTQLAGPNLLTKSVKLILNVAYQQPVRPDMNPLHSDGVNLSTRLWKMLQTTFCVIAISSFCQQFEHNFDVKVIN